jgi:hypothetical protein
MESDSGHASTDFVLPSPEDIVSSEAYNSPAPLRTAGGYTSLVPHACAFCKQRKLKCSFGNPCDQCQKREISCIYLKRLPGKKRGPKPKAGKLLQGKETIDPTVSQLEQLLVEQMDRIRQLEQQVEQLTTQKSVTAATLPIAPLVRCSWVCVDLKHRSYCAVCLFSSTRGRMCRTLPLRRCFSLNRTLHSKELKCFVTTSFRA